MHPHFLAKICSYALARLQEIVHMAYFTACALVFDIKRIHCRTFVLIKLVQWGDKEMPLSVHFASTLSTRNLQTYQFREISREQNFLEF